MTTKLSTSNLSAETLAAISGPRISNVQIADSAYNTLDDTAANIGGGYIIINGQSFNSAAQVLIDQTPATTITWVSNTQIRAQVPAAAEGTSRSVYVINPDGSLALLVNGLTYSAFPAWSTGSTLTSFEALVPISIQLSAPTANNYTLAASNTLPSSVILYANGLIAGTVAANTTTNYNFTVIAKDNENQDTSRSFTLPITKNNEPAWVTAADLGSAFVDANYSNTLVATDVSNVTYSVAAGSSLPSSLTLAANGLLSGNVSSPNTYSFGIVATDTANLSNTRTFTITITAVADTFFKNTTLLLNGETTVTPFISDASTNSFGLTINGDTEPTPFNPYTPGYYSNFFDGTGDYLTTSDNAAFQFGTGDFTVEAWVYPSVVNSSQRRFYSYQAGGTSTVFWIGISTTNKFSAEMRGSGGGSSTQIYSTTTPVASTWYHVAFVRSGTTTYLFVNGSLETTTTSQSQSIGSGGTFNIGQHNSGDYWYGYISDLRVVKGSAVYTSAFTPSTTPLTAIANTSLLTCQSNRFIDNSTNNFTITKAGDTLISPNIPFAPNASYSTYGSTYFDGTGDYLTIAGTSTACALPGNFTIECWYYQNTSSALFYGTIFSTTAAYATTNSLRISTGENNNTIQVASAGSGVLNASVTFTPRTWVHLALVRSGTTLTLYQNGVSVASTTNSQSFVSDTFIIGDTQGSGAPYCFNGYISNFRVVKGTAVYTTAFTPPTTPLTAIANTSLLTLQYNGGATNQGIIDNSNFNNTITRNGNTSQGTFSPYSVTGWSNYFDGTGDYLSFPNNSAFAFGTGSFTIEFWINAPLNNDKFILSGRAGIGSLHITTGGYNGTTTVGALRYGSTDIGTSVVVCDNTWHHCAIVRDGSSAVTMYVDGVSRATTTDSTNYTTTAGIWYIATNDSGPPQGVLTGYISNLRIIKGTALYTTSFTPSTTPFTPIANTSLLTCQSNRLIDNSPNSFTLTRNGDVSVQAFDPFGSIGEATPLSYSNFFDGTGDYLYTSASSANAMGTGDYTVEAWIYVTAAFGTTGSGRGAIISNRGQESAGAAFMLQHYNGKIYFGTSGTDVIVGSTTMVTNTWYHVVVSRSSGTVRLFLNGVSDATAVTGNSTNHSDTNAFYVGIDGAYDRYPFTGYISNARLVKGTAVYTSAFTPSTTPLTAIANTSLLTCQSTTMIDNSTNRFTITAAGNTVPRQFNPFGYTAQSATSYTPSLHGGSAYFDGTTDYLSIPSNVTQFTFGTGNFTIEFWLYLNSTGQQIIWDGRPGSAALTIYYYDSALRYYTNAADRIVGSSLSTGQWYHIALCRSSTSTKMFINGTQTGSTYSDSTTYTTSAPIIGADANAGNGSLSLNGYLSDIRVTKGFAIYTSNFVPPAQTLTNYSTTNPASLLLNFNNGGIIDQHSTNVLETVGNAQLSTAVKKYGTGSIAFDGTGDYLTFAPTQATAFGTGDFTIEMWLYITASPGDYAYIYAQGPNTTASMNLYIQGGVFRIWNGSAVIIGSTSYALNTWYHVAISRSGTSLRLFVNGVQDGSATNSSNIPTGSTYGATIGNWTEIGDNRYFAGYIDDLRITKGYARYTANFTPPTSALITK
jgi:hypothetical protein